MAENREKGLHRSLKIDRDKINPDKRTVELAFSSEEPVERWGENEVLSHEKGDYDFSRLNADHPLLLGHGESDAKSQIGVIESARVDKDKVGRAVVRFGNSFLAKEIFQDVQDGIRTLVSVGYDRTGIVESKKAKDGMVTTRYRWQPSHIAIVPVPADITVGVGREQVDSPKEVNLDALVKNLKPEEKTRMKILLSPETAAGGGTATIDEAKLRADAKDAAKKELAARKKELRTRADEIIKDFPLAADKLRSMVDEAVESDEDIEKVSFRMLKEAGVIKPAKELRMADLNMSEHDQRSYSILRGIQSTIRRGFKDGPDGLEGEVDAELRKRNLGFAPEGFVVPADAPIRIRERRAAQRDLQVNVFAQGGATVATELIVPIIEILRNKMVTQKLGVRQMAGLEGNVVIPRQTGAATAYAVSEIQGLTISTQALDQIPLTPKRVGAYNQYSKQLLLQSSIDVENFIRDDLMKVIAIIWDRLILYGQGAASEPLGVVNTAGVGSVTFGAAATFAKLVAFWTAVATANADVGEMGYITSPAAAGILQSAAKLLTGATTVAAVPLWEGGGTEGRINNYRAEATNQISNNQMLFGVWSEVIHGLWGGYDVVVNPYSLDTNAEVRITINTWGDVAVRHAQCFTVSTDSAAQ